LNAAVDRFVARVGHWEPERWAKPAPSGQPRSDMVHALVQALADLCRGLEGLPARAVPRLDNDLALPDQVRVMAADLLLAGAPDEALHHAADQVDATTRSL
jgi:hypothetical protein